MAPSGKGPKFSPKNLQGSPPTEIPVCLLVLRFGKLPVIRVVISALKEKHVWDSHWLRRCPIDKTPTMLVFNSVCWDKWHKTTGSLMLMTCHRFQSLRCNTGGCRGLLGPALVVRIFSSELCSFCQKLLQKRRAFRALNWCLAPPKKDFLFFRSCPSEPEILPWKS